MKLSLKEITLSLGSSVLMMASIFHKPLGLPDNCQIIFMAAALVCLFLFNRSRSLTKSVSSKADTQKSTTSKRTWKFWIIIIPILVISSASFPFLARYTSVTLPFPQLVIISIVCFFISMAVVLFGKQK